MVHPLVTLELMTSNLVHGASIVFVSVFAGYLVLLVGLWLVESISNKR